MSTRNMVVNILSNTFFNKKKLYLLLVKIHICLIILWEKFPKFKIDKNFTQ